MTTFYRLILSAIVTLIAILSIRIILDTPASEAAQRFDLGLLSIIFIACLASALLSPKLRHKPAAKNSSANTAKSNTSTGGARETGTVKWFNVSKGYGFVTCNNGEDVFVHFRSIRGEGRRTLSEGQEVEFTLAEGDKGPQAEDVEALSKARRQ